MAVFTSSTAKGDVEHSRYGYKAGATYSSGTAMAVPFFYSTIGFSFKKLARKTADRDRKAQITALCSTPPIHYALNSSFMLRGVVAIL